jgi:hypothetical protein
MWRLCKLGYRHEPRLMLVSFILALVAALPDALIALWLMLLGKGVLDHSSVLVATAAMGLGISATATWFLRTVSTRVQRRFRDKVTIALESHIARLQASVTTIAHQERPEYLDRLSVLRQSGVCAGSHVHVVVHDVQLDPAAGRDDRAPDVHPSGVDSSGSLFGAHGHDVNLAARHRAARAGTGRSGWTACATFVHHGDHRAAWKRGARHRHSREADH